MSGRQDVAERIKEIVLMAAVSFEGGQHHALRPSSKHYVDPEAAGIVSGQVCPITNDAARCHSKVLTTKGAG